MRKEVINKIESFYYEDGAHKIDTYDASMRWAEKCEKLYKALLDIKNSHTKEDGKRELYTTMCIFDSYQVIKDYEDWINGSKTN